MTEHTEKLFFVLYMRIKYQFASEIKNPVDGTTSENAQIPFAGPEGVAASSETPTVMSANESKRRSDCITEAFQLFIRTKESVAAGTEVLTALSSFMFS